MLFWYNYKVKEVERILYTEEVIAKRVKELAEQINTDYFNKDLMVVGVLKGCLPFLSDLIKHITLTTNVTYLKASSYQGTQSTNNLKITSDVDLDVSNKDVLIVEDIIDAGLTLSEIKKHILTKNPKSIRIITLLDKVEARKYPITVDYVGFKIANEFVIGYGLDYNEKYRNLPYIGVFNLEYLDK